MKRPYRNIGFFFLLLLVLVFAGFTPRIPGTPFFGYFSQGSQFAQVPLVIHVHAAISLTWFGVLVAQAFLVRANRLAAHRLLGWMSVAVAVLLVLTAVQVMKHFYATALLRLPKDTVLSALSQSFTGLTLFCVFFAVALWKRRTLHWHVAFMLATALVAATPGLARLGLYAVGGLPGILTVMVLIYATLIGFMLHAKLRWHLPILRGPYLPIIAMFLAAHAMDFVGSRTATWRWLAERIVSVW